MRLTSTITLLSLTSIAGLVACGDDGGSATPDAPPKDIGFNKPTAPLKANMEMSADNWVEIGPADLACLGMASADVASTVEVTINTKVEDFQSGNDVANASVIAFPDTNTAAPFNAPVMSMQDATVSVVIPAGTKRFGYKMTHPNAMDTLLLNQKLADPSTTPQSVSRIQSVSTATAATLPALIGVSRTPGTGVLAGAVRDCQDREISNFIATVSSTAGTVTHVDGVDTYYFSSSVGLPVRHSQQAFSNKDGLFMAIEMNPTAQAYIQVWGYPTQADVDSDNLTLIAEVASEVIADTVITGSYEPKRN